MLNLKEYWHLNGKQIVVICADGQRISGLWMDWTSAQDNDPDPESIGIAKPWGEQIEIFVKDIQSIQEAP